MWRAFLDLPPDQLGNYASFLSKEERERAGRFVLERDRRRFITARGYLRHFLAQYLACEPEQVSLRHDAGGRPALVPPPGEVELRFSVSHSHELALFAFSYSHRIGIDVERMRPIPDVESIVQDAFSPRELAAWRVLSEDLQQEAFFHGWTRKEAYLKAVGVGLAWPPNRIEVNLEPGEGARLLSVHDDPGEAAGWSLVTLYPAAGYVGALAVEASHALAAFSFGVSAPASLAAGPCCTVIGTGCSQDPHVARKLSRSIARAGSNANAKTRSG